MHRFASLNTHPHNLNILPAIIQANMMNPTTSSSPSFYNTQSFSSPSTNSMRQRRKYLEYPIHAEQQQSPSLSNHKHHHRDTRPREDSTTSTNVAIFGVLIPPLALIYFLYLPDFAQFVVNALILIWYCLDLLNLRVDFCLSYAWIGIFGIPSFYNMMRFFVFRTVFEGDGRISEGAVYSVMSFLWRSSLNMMECGLQNFLWVGLVGFISLQYQHFQPKYDAHYSTMMRLSIYSILPVVSAIVLTYYGNLGGILGFNIGASYVYTIILSINTCIITSYTDWEELLGYSQGEKIKRKVDMFMKEVEVAQELLWVGVPILVHFVTTRRHLFVDIINIFDLIIACAFPLFLLLSFTQNKLVWWNRNNIISKPSGMVFYITSATVYLAIQQRFLVPLCLDSRFFIDGMVSDMNVTLKVSMYLVVGTLSIVLTYFAVLDEKFGEFNEDMFLLLTSAGLSSYCLAAGFPWALFPSFILAGISILLFIVSRQVRYLLIFLLVVALSLSAFVLFRVSMLSSITLGGLSLIRFGYLSIFALALIGFAVGFAFRASGGVGSGTKIDFVGVLMVLYVVVLSYLESSVVVGSLHGLSQSLKYPVVFALCTSVLLLLSCHNLSREEKISSFSAVLTACFSVGKLAAYLEDEDEGWAERCILRSFSCSLLLSSVFIPFNFVDSARSTNTSQHKFQHVNLSATKYREWLEKLVPTTGIIVLLSSRILMKPFLSCFYSLIVGRVKSIGVSEIVGACLVLWALQTLSLVNFCAPPSDPFARTIKKSSSLIFLFGLALLFGSPSLELFGDARITSDLKKDDGIFANYSWGLILVVVSVLLSLAGPLNFRPTRYNGFSKFKAICSSVIFALGLTCVVSSYFSPNTGGMVAAFNVISTSIGVYSSLYILYSDAQSSIILLPMHVTSALLLLYYVTYQELNDTTTFLFLIASSYGLFALSLKNRRNSGGSFTSTDLVPGILSWLSFVALTYIKFGISDYDQFTIGGLSPSLAGTFLSSFVLWTLSTRWSHKEKSLLEKVQEVAEPVILGNCLILLPVSAYVVFFRGCGMSGSDNILSVGQFDVRGPSELNDLLKNQLTSLSKTVLDVGFCTSSSWSSPIIHSVGLLLICPSAVLLVLSYFDSTKFSRSSLSAPFLVLSLASLLMCRGFGHMSLLALLTALGVASQMLSERRLRHKRNMNI